jgi:hypothetical protein
MPRQLAAGAFTRDVRRVALRRNVEESSYNLRRAA